MTAPQTNVIDLEYRRQLANFAVFLDINKSRINAARDQFAAGMIGAEKFADQFEGARLTLRFIEKQIDDLEARQCPS